VTQTEERPGAVTEALQKPLPRTNAENTAMQYTFAKLPTVLGHVTNDRRDKVSVSWQHAGIFMPDRRDASQGAVAS
jgi:hypothetical protein